MSDSAQHLQGDFSTRHFRDALGAFATGVTIVTTLDASGQPVGLTVNSFSSVSLEPPLVLWSLVNKASSHDAFLQSTHFAVNVLAADQLLLAQRFASRGVDRFKDLDYVAGGNGMPLLPGALAWFECERYAEHAAGDHTIFIGKVLQVGYQGASPRDLPAAEPSERPQAHLPLLYHRGVMYAEGSVVVDAGLPK